MKQTETIIKTETISIDTMFYIVQDIHAHDLLSIITARKSNHIFIRSNQIITLPKTN